MTNYPELQTIRDFIRFATTQFTEAGLYYGHGTDNAWDEAIAIILRSLNLTHQIIEHVLDAKLTAAERTKIIDLIDKRVKTRIPAAYLIHEAWFCRLPFYVDERVLIPRSPIAELIENHFEPWIDSTQVNSILDLCTGSGCIAIACAKYFPDADIDASDISSDALTVAKINILRHEVEHHVNLIESNLFDQLATKKYDLIVSNPPYVSLDEMSALPNEYRHEPSLGLEAGQLGLDLVYRILHDAANHLTPNGMLICEVGNSEHALANEFPEVPFMWIEFERGGGGVFALTAHDLKKYRDQFAVKLENLNA